MEEIKTIKEKTIELIDALKATCQTYGMGNDGNEYKIITQVFLYKFLNDKFGYEVKKVSPVLKNAEKWELVNVKTTNMGSLYKLTYQLTMRNTDKEKEMIDRIRCRNGNLEINVSRQDTVAAEL